MLKICESPDRKIYDNIGIQCIDQKCKEVVIKIQANFCNGLTVLPTLHPTIKFITEAYTIRVFMLPSCTHYTNGTQLLVSLLHHWLKVRLLYRGVYTKALQIII